MYCLSESLLVKTPSCLAGIFAFLLRNGDLFDIPHKGAGKASAERPNENFHATTASCPFMGNVEEIAVPKEEGKDVRRTERGLIPLCEGWNINEKT